jgi:hypothetical protein
LAEAAAEGVRQGAEPAAKAARVGKQKKPAADPIS